MGRQRFRQGRISGRRLWPFREAQRHRRLKRRRSPKRLPLSGAHPPTTFRPARAFEIAVHRGTTDMDRGNGILRHPLFQVSGNAVKLDRAGGNREVTNNAHLPCSTATNVRPSPAQSLLRACFCRNWLRDFSPQSKPPISADASTAEWSTASEFPRKRISQRAADRDAPPRKAPDWGPGRGPAWQGSDRGHGWKAGRVHRVHTRRASWHSVRHCRDCELRKGSVLDHRGALEFRLLLRRQPDIQTGVAMGDG